jgi:hypothetical protein
LLDEKRVQTYAVLRPARGDVYDLESGGPITAVPPPRSFGTVDPPEAMSLSGSLPSGLRLPTPPSAPRMMVSSRALQADEGTVSVQWTGSDRKTLEVKNGAGFPLRECWAVSKETVWSLGEIGAASSRRIELKNPYPFKAWASQQLRALKADERNTWWRYNVSWDRVNPDRYGLVLTFHEAFNEAWDQDHNRHLLLEKGIDFSPALAREEVIMVGSFDGNLAAIRTRPEIRAEVFGWARVRVREATR